MLMTRQFVAHPATRRIDPRAIAVADAIVWLADFTMDATRAFAYAILPTWLGLHAVLWWLVPNGHMATAVITIIATAIIGVALVIAGLLPDEPQAVTR